jgi:phytoene desaturase
MRPRVAIVGAGLGGLSASIYLASRGVEVTLFEKNEAPGGKAGERWLGPYRFDTGPSLVTMRFVLEEVFRASGSALEREIELVPLDPLCRYHFDDGSVLDASADAALMAEAIGAFSRADGKRYTDFLRYAGKIYELTSELFLFNSITDPKALFTLSSLKTLMRIWQIDPFRTVDASVRRFFTDPRIIQLFDRYATYNGSDPYRAPATLNIIPYVEYALGGFYVRGGISALVDALTRRARSLGVRLETGVDVREIVVEGGRASAVASERGTVSGFDAVVSNADAVHTLTQMMRGSSRRTLGRTPEPSSSGVVFLWAVGREHPSLAHHNIFFSRDYRKEFHEIFGEGIVPNDPTVYVSITSKTDPGHAPRGAENWFVLVNVPSSEEGLTDHDLARLRERVLARLRRAGVDPSVSLTAEEVIRPQDFRDRFHAYRGSIYGWSSNSRSAAFLRPANRVRSVRGLYLCGGAAHPGGGIPLVLLSGRIAARLCLRDLGLGEP